MDIEEKHIKIFNYFVGLLLLILNGFVFIINKYNLLKNHQSDIEIVIAIINLYLVYQYKNTLLNYAKIIGDYIARKDIWFIKKLSGKSEYVEDILKAALMLFLWLLFMMLFMVYYSYYR